MLGIFGDLDRAARGAVDADETIEIVAAGTVEETDRVMTIASFVVSTMLHPTQSGWIPYYRFVPFVLTSRRFLVLRARGIFFLTRPRPVIRIQMSRVGLRAWVYEDITTTLALADEAGRVRLTLRVGNRYRQEAYRIGHLLGEPGQPVPT